MAVRAMSSSERPLGRSGSSRQPGRVFGIPLGELGLFTSLLMAFAFGFLVFFATCFVAIFGLLFYNSAGHHAVDMADSYRYFALPAGLVALSFALVVLLGLWVRRKVAGR
jgi:TRAP-type C4-dicarboxylate transport system permease small subunit